MQKIFLLASLFLLFQNSLAAQCLTQPSCPPSPPLLCDTTDNDPFYWNDLHFQDVDINSSNLGEAATALTTQVVSSCGTANVQVSFVLLLDLNGDGQPETAVSSAALPGADTVYFGNAANPNYTGGVASHFDARPVPPNQKYGFRLEKTVQDSLVTARVRWASALAPGTYITPQLPYGTHRIEWRFEKDGEVKTCAYTFVIKDCKAPAVVCNFGLSVNIMPTQMIQLWATDFLQYAEDNHTPVTQLKYALRRSGTGTGFPFDGNGQPITAALFTCADLGVQPVELWSIDAAGNANFCETSVIIQDNNGNCMTGGNDLVACAIHHCDGAGISEVTFDLSGNYPGVPPISVFMGGSDSTGCVTFDNSIPLASNLTVTPEKDNNPLNGVSTFDLVLISRHILGLEPLDSPYKMIAADANKSGSLTTYDIVELRKLLLGIYQELPNNTSWRFVDSSFVFPNASNPFQTMFPENTSFGNIQAGVTSVFYGIKIGDVNCTASQNSASMPPEEALTIPNLQLQVNDIVEVPVGFMQANGYWGYQFGLHFDPALIEVLEVLPELGGLDNFGIFTDRVNVSWLALSPQVFLPNEPVFKLRIRALAALHLADVFNLSTGDLHAEAYPADESLIRLRLQFATVATTEPDGERQIFAPQPNPTNAGVRIPLRLEQAETVTVEIMDATGRLLYRQAQTVSAGAQMLDVPATAFPQAGTYFWRVQAGEASRTGKVVRN